ncbi:uncharacterized protein DNG_08155 [Cephalotrichum gorgonifer]|uniref:Uncharacterized protein n=1 Tax=Cephalotrichum gorgonifer TaxID=2041049 RepID=A0AAE8N5I3_9PEZI|nr:uncharacterized protein DNG_08155 [Cephalotrichum gorgonifer]
MGFVEAFFLHELSPAQRINFVYPFLILGLVICAQISQLPEKPPARWARITKESKLYWQTAWVLEAFLLTQLTYDIIKDKMAEFGLNDTFLNGVWLGLLALEALLVLGVAARIVSRKLQVAPKEKTT